MATNYMCKMKFYVILPIGNVIETQDIDVDNKFVL